jgi:hypothetical protein
MANTMLNLYRRGLQEVEEAERLEVTLAEDGIAYCGSVGDAGPSTSIPGPSSSVPGSSTSVPGPSMSWDDIDPHTYMNITNSSLSYSDAPDLSQVLQSLVWAKVIIRYSYMLLYVMRIIDICIVSLILIKCYVMLNVV